MHDRTSTPFNFLREYSIPLLAGVATALAWVNIHPQSYNHYAFEPVWLSASLKFWVNEIFMVFFFGIAAVEIIDSFLPGGGLNPPRRAVNPLLATLGGVAVPAGLFFAVNAVWGGPELTHGWGITTATDIALAWLVARIIFGKGHPAIAFLLLLAVADDAIGLVIIAFFYRDPNNATVPGWLGLVVLGVLAAWTLRRFRVNNYWPYLLAPGVICWFGLHQAHLHPALALVFVVPFMPHQVKPPGEMPFEQRRDANSALTRFEHEWKVLVDFGLFFFGLVNAGTEFSAIGPVTWIVLVSLVCGKTFGVLGLGLLGRMMGFALPDGIGVRELLLVGMTAGIGLTVALFVAGAAFTDPAIEGAAKMGALLSAAAALPAILLGRILRVGVKPSAPSQEMESP
jgi:NhaA family Na+:H+ antiporter